MAVEATKRSLLALIGNSQAPVPFMDGTLKSHLRGTEGASLGENSQVKIQRDARV